MSFPPFRVQISLSCLSVRVPVLQPKASRRWDFPSTASNKTDRGKGTEGQKGKGEGENNPCFGFNETVLPILNVTQHASGYGWIGY